MDQLLDELLEWFSAQGVMVRLLWGWLLTVGVFAVIVVGQILIDKYEQLGEEYGPVKDWLIGLGYIMLGLGFIGTCMVMSVVMASLFSGKYGSFAFCMIGILTFGLFGAAMGLASRIKDKLN